MKRNLGSKVVRKTICLAMALMLTITCPMAKVNATESSEPAVSAVSEGTTGSYSEQFTEQTGYELTEDEAAIIDKYVDELVNVDVESGNKAYIDGVKDVIENAVNDEEHGVGANVDKAENAASEAEDIADKAEEANETAKDYVEALDTVINADSNLVGNDNINGIEFIGENKDNDPSDVKNNCADIKVNVTDSEGNTTQESLIDYTEAKAEVAKDAADKAQDIAGNVTAATDVEAARQELDKAAAEAAGAVKDAETAYNSAVDTLDSEITYYNSIIIKYYTFEEAEKLGLLKKDSSGNYPSYDIENVMSKEEMDAAFSGLEDKKKVIDDAQKLVSDCEEAVKLAQNSVNQVKEADKQFVASLQGMIQQAQEAVKNCENLDPNSEEYKQAQKALAQVLAATRSELNKYIGQAEEELKSYENSNTTEPMKQYLDNLSHFVSASKDLVNTIPEDVDLKDVLTEIANGVSQGAEEILKWYTAVPTDPNAEMGQQETVHYAVDTADALIDQLIGDANEKYDGVLGQATEKVEDAMDAYADAALKYEEAKKAYEAAGIFEKITSLKAKLEAAEADLLQAKANYDSAVKDLQIVEDSKKSFEESVKKFTDSEPTTPDNNNNNNNDNNNDSTPAAPSTTPAPTTIPDEAVPQSDTIPETVIIPDEATPLDDVPKTGDSLPASLPFACTGALAFIGAAFINLKKRFTR